MARRPSRSEWHQHKGLWSRSLGNRGLRVRLFQKRKDGVFYRSLWVPGRGYDKKCLGTCDRAHAVQLGRALLAALLKDEELTRPGALSLWDLWERYRNECVAFKGYSERMRKETEGRMEVLLGYFGSQSDVRSLSEQDQIAFVQKRLGGGINVGKDKHGNDRLTKPVRQRSAHEDMQLLRTVLRWATTNRLRSGARLLDRNPLEGVKLPGRGSNPRRPVATFERFTATRAAIVQLQDGAADDAELRKWVRLELALLLAEATGRRLGSIRQLAWNDIDLAANTIRWKAANDKKRKEWIIPIPPALRTELRHFRSKLGGAFGGFVFPSDTNSDVPTRRDVLDKWLRQAEAKAELPKLDGSLWHAYRRAWATSRKDLPTADVAAAGGWSDIGTLLRCYQQPDDATMLAVMGHQRKVV